MKPALQRLWRQAPFLLWLIVLWMLLWGAVTWMTLLGGILAAVVVAVAFRMPPIELSGRVNVFWLVVYIAEAAWAMATASLVVAWQVLDPRRLPGTAIIAVRLRTDDDVIMTQVGVTASLIPGSLVVEADRENRVLYLHFLGVNDAADVERHRAGVAHWEKRIVQAIGSREQVAALAAGVPEPDRGSPGATSKGDPS